MILLTIHSYIEGVTFHSLLFEIHSLLVTHCNITRYSLQNSLVAHCRSCSLQEIIRYSLQKLLVAKHHSLLVAKFSSYSLQKLLVAKNHSLLVAKFSSYSLQKLLVAKNHSSLIMKKTGELNVYLKPIKLGEFYLFIPYFQLSKNRKDSVHNKISIAKIYCDIVQSAI